jgi:hypothetical protein
MEQRRSDGLHFHLFIKEEGGVGAFNGSLLVASIWSRIVQPLRVRHHPRAPAPTRWCFLLRVTIGIVDAEDEARDILVAAMEGLGRGDGRPGHRQADDPPQDIDVSPAATR